MKLILIDGGPASGKNTLGKILSDDLNTHGNKSILLDLDNYVEEFCPTWIWDNNQQKEKDLSSARINLVNDINKHLKENFDIIVIGERFLTEEDIAKYTNKLSVRCSVYLYHLSVPIALRKQRLEQRGPHSLIDLDKDQKDRDAVITWPGHVYQNVNSLETDALNLMKLIQNGIGLVK